MSEEPVPWLDDVEAATWLSLVSTSEWLQPALDIQLRRDAGITHFEYGILAALSSATDRTLRLSALARSANSTYSRLSRALDRLSDRGWVLRRPDPDSGRTTLATLTDAGMEKVARTAPGHVRRVRELVFDVLTRDEVERLGTITAKIAAAVGPHGACAEKLT